MLGFNFSRLAIILEKKHVQVTSVLPVIMFMMNCVAIEI